MPEPSLHVFSDIYICMDIMQRPIFLSRLIHNMTLMGRDLLFETNIDIDCIWRIKGINEIIHVLSSHLTDLLRNDQKRYSDDVFSSIVDAEANAYNIIDRLQSALKLTKHPVVPRVE